MPPLCQLQQHRVGFHPITTGWIVEAGLLCTNPRQAHQRPAGGLLDVIRRPTYLPLCPLLLLGGRLHSARKRFLGSVPGTNSCEMQPSYFKKAWIARGRRLNGIPAPTLLDAVLWCSPHPWVFVFISQLPVPERMVHIEEMRQYPKPLIPHEKYLCGNKTRLSTIAFHVYTSYHDTNLHTNLDMLLLL